MTNATAKPLLALTDASTIDIPLEQLTSPPFQVRSGASEEAKAAGDELRDSLDEHGQLEVIIVRRIGVETAHHYEVLAGNRRVEQARKLRWRSLRATVTDADCNDAAAFQISVLDNMKRANLSPMEEATQLAYGARALNMNVEALCGMVKRSERWVAERLALLELHPKIQTALGLGVVNIAEAKSLQPAATLGVDAILDAALARVELDTDGAEASGRPANVPQIVRQVIAEGTVSLGKQTPFDWAERCKKAGCLAEGPAGPVCTDPKMWFKACIEGALPEMDAALAKMLKGNRYGIDKHRRVEAVEAKRDGMSKLSRPGTQLPVFYDLSALQPNGSAIATKGRPKLPLKLVEFVDRAEPAAGAWPMRLLGREVSATCLDCPAYSAKTKKDPGRAIVVSAGSRHMMEATPSAAIVCMNGPCRERKLSAGQTDVEKRNAKREHDKRAASKIAGEVALGGAALLAKNRPRALAVSLLDRRQSMKAEPSLAWEVTELLKLLGLKLPLGKTIIDQLVALGEQDLIRLIALRFVARQDGALIFDGWKPSAVKATLGLVLSERHLGDLQATAEPTAKRPAKAKRAAKKRPAKRAGKKRPAKAER